MVDGNEGTATPEGEVVALMAAAPPNRRFEKARRGAIEWRAIARALNIGLFERSAGFIVDC